ncbi:MAG: histidine--tRNA ligase [Flavobacteriales bacterium]|jgi:histidyl-tRNA synthetase
MVGIPKGTRDFGPEVMVRRNYIFGVIKNIFERYGYLPLETPTMENLSTLTGKYGDEGDQLIFKVLNNGDYLKDADDAALSGRDSKKLSFSICDRALRYDLTVPFARFVVMNHNQLALPFKRYQIQPVWRADRPQKGRYREFYQCDVDVVGSNSLINEVELIQIFDDVLTQLGLPDFTIKINNRKLLTGLAALTGAPERMMDMTVAIDKLDKIGVDGVKKELIEKGFSESQWNIIESVLTLEGSNDEKLERMKILLGENEIALKGIEEMQFILQRVKAVGLERAKLELDLTLARGLNYYTGAIFEVKANGVQMGSICGGGRYDDLTGIFGLPGLSGVGISFGADRIYDVMMELNLFPTEIGATTKILFANFGEQEEMHILPILRKIRQAGINAEIYPEAAKMKKQFKYADDKKIPFVGVIGTEEIQKNVIALKNMTSGEQELLSLEQVIEKLK